MAFLVCCKRFCIAVWVFFPSYDCQRSTIYWKKRWAKWLKVPVLCEMDANSRRAVVMLLRAWEPAARSRTVRLSWLIMKLCEDAVVLSNWMVIHSCLCWALTELTVFTSRQPAKSETNLESWAPGNSPSEEAWSGWVRVWHSVPCRTSGNCPEAAACGETTSLQGYLLNLYYEEGITSTEDFVCIQTSA